MRITVLSGRRQADPVISRNSPPRRASESRARKARACDDHKIRGGVRSRGVSVVTVMTWLLRVDVGVRSWVVLHRVPPLDWPLLALSAIADNGALWLVVATVLAIVKYVRWRDVGRLAL